MTLPWRIREFDGLVRRLTDAGVEVVVADDPPEPAKPDACFPNNWVSFHADGTVVLYPMLAPSRRAERRPEHLAAVERAGFRIARTIDLSSLEGRGEFLEGTGSLVLDRSSRLAYACLSPRTTPAALAEFCAALGYRAVEFDALGPDGRAIYHTNVLMAVGEGFAVVCAAAIPDAPRRAAVLDELARIGSRGDRDRRRGDEPLRGQHAGAPRARRRRAHRDVGDRLAVARAGEASPPRAPWRHRRRAHPDDRMGGRRQRALHDRRSLPSAR